MELSSTTIENLIYGVIGFTAMVGVAYKTWKKSLSGEKAVNGDTKELLTNDQQILKETVCLKQMLADVQEDIDTMTEDISALKLLLSEVDKDNKRNELTRNEMYKILIKLEDRCNHG